MTTLAKNWVAILNILGVTEIPSHQFHAIELERVGDLSEKNSTGCLHTTSYPLSIPGLPSRCTHNRSRYCFEIMLTFNFTILRQRQLRRTELLYKSLVKSTHFFLNSSRAVNNDVAHWIYLRENDCYNRENKNKIKK